MIHRSVAAGTSLALALFVAGAWGAERLESGPQVGKQIPGPFNPLNVTGSAAGTKQCQV